MLQLRNILTEVTQPADIDLIRARHSRERGNLSAGATPLLPASPRFPRSRE